MKTESMNEDRGEEPLFEQAITRIRAAANRLCVDVDAVRFDWNGILELAYRIWDVTSAREAHEKLMRAYPPEIMGAGSPAMAGPPPGFIPKKKRQPVVEVGGKGPNFEHLADVLAEAGFIPDDVERLAAVYRSRFQSRAETKEGGPK